jgi:hypothetical protein
VTNRVITAVAAAATTTTTTTTTKAVLIKFNLFIYDFCPLNTQRIEEVAMVEILLLLLLLLLLLSLSPLCRVFTIIYLKQTMFPGYLVLQLCCIYNMRYL